MSMKNLKVVVLCIAIFCCNKIAIAHKAKSNTVRTEYVTKYDKKLKKQITHKESVQKYNENGDVAEEWNYNKDGEVNKHVKYFYNAEGKKLKEVHYNNKNQATKVAEFSYDEQGRKVEEKHYDTDSPKDITVHRFEYAEQK